MGKMGFYCTTKIREKGVPARDLLVFLEIYLVCMV